MTDVSKLLRAALANRAHIAELGIELAQVSADGTRKLRLTTADNRVIESVLIPDDDARTLALKNRRARPVMMPMRTTAKKKTVRAAS